MIAGALGALVAVSGSAASAVPAPPGPVVSLVSKVPDGGFADSWSAHPKISGDGRYVAFESLASDLVPGDTPGGVDVFRVDTTTGQTIAVSKLPSGLPNNKSHGLMDINRNGRFIVYLTPSRRAADGLPAKGDRFVLYDAGNDTSQVISQRPDGELTTIVSGIGSLSANGRYFAYVSLTRPNQPGSGYHLYRYDRVLNSTVELRRVSNRRDGLGGGPSISGGGRYIAYLTAPPLGDALAPSRSLHLLDVRTDTSTPVSVTPPGQVQGVTSADISDSGQLITYSSNTPGLVADDTGPWPDVFVYDAAAATTTLISRNLGGEPADNSSTSPVIGSQYGVIAYVSAATALVADDGQPYADVFVYHPDSGVTHLISRAPDGGPASEISTSPSITGSGGEVVFESSANNLVAGDPNSWSDVFRWRE